LTEEGKAYDLKHKLLEYFERKRKQIPIIHGALHNKSSIDPIPEAIYQEDPIYLRNAAGNIINPSTEETLTSVLNKLADILAKLDVALSTRASESSLTSILSRKLTNSLGNVINPSTEDTLASILAKLNVALSTRASESSLTSTLPRNITQWSGTPLTGRDISLDLSFIGGHRFKNYGYDSGYVTVPANSYVDTTSISGIGMALVLNQIISSGIPASNSEQYLLLDGTRDLLIQIPDIFGTSFFGAGAVGNYTWGSKGIRVKTWDTTNNNYEVYHIGEPHPTYFRNTFCARLKNTHATASSTQKVSLQYCLFTASKVIYAKMQSQSDIHDASFLRKKLIKQGIKPIAIVVQRLGYYDETTRELPPLMREFPKDLPNEADDERILPDGTKIKSRKHDTAHQVIEVHVDESVSTDDVIKVIEPAKFLKEETV
jgi:hypothetical protein